jgi:hypothetical protein
VILKSAGVFFANYRGWPGLTGMGLFDMGLGTICAVDCGSDAWRDRGPAVDRACGLGPLVRGGPITHPKGYAIWDIHPLIDGSGALGGFGRRL